MKRNHSVAKAIEPAKPIPTATLSSEKDSQLPDEDPNLSPERLMEGASVKTTLLSQILAQQEEFHGLRHWGINE